MGLILKEKEVGSFRIPDNKSLQNKSKGKSKMQLLAKMVKNILQISISSKREETKSSIHSPTQANSH